MSGTEEATPCASAPPGTLFVPGACDNSPLPTVGTVSIVDESICSPDHALGSLILLFRLLFHTKINKMIIINSATPPPAAEPTIIAIEGVLDPVVVDEALLDTEVSVAGPVTKVIVVCVVVTSALSKNE